MFKRDFKGLKISLGTLRVGKQIGFGGYGTVHEARLAGLDLNFAVKFLDPTAFHNPDSSRKRFAREAEMLLSLRHRYIIGVFGFGEHDDGTRFILMERFVGVNLRKARANVGVPAPRQVFPFLERAAEGLSYAHENGVVHRDVRPENLMTRKGDTRILDFGIATYMDPGRTRLTQSTIGGDAYSAPELSEDPQGVHPRLDVYSLGACWFFLLTGSPPTGMNVEATLRRAVKVTPEYEAFLHRCLMPADERYESMGELLADLSSLRDGGSPEAVTGALDDDDKLVLGMVLASGPGGEYEGTTFYELEQEAGPLLARFKLSMTVRKLVRLKLVAEAAVAQNNWGDTADGYAATAEGVRYGEVNSASIAELHVVATTRSDSHPGCGLSVG